MNVPAPPSFFGREQEEQTLHVHPLPKSQQSVKAGREKGLSAKPVPLRQQKGKAQFYDCWPQHNLPFTN